MSKMLLPRRHKAEDTGRWTLCIRKSLELEAKAMKAQGIDIVKLMKDAAETAILRAIELRDQESS